VHPASHALISWLVAEVKDLPRRDRILVFAAGLLPDLDGLVILGGTEMYQRWHHVILHNGLSAVVYGAIVAGLAKGNRLLAGFLTCLVWHLHLLADWFGSGGPDGSQWSIPYLVPFDFTDYYAPYQWPLASWQNVVITVVAIVLSVVVALRRGRTVVDAFSLKADAKVMAVLRQRFGGEPKATDVPPTGDAPVESSEAEPRA